MESSASSPSTKPIFKGTQVIWWLLGVLEVFLAFRFGLKLLGANPGAGFTDFVYGATWPFTAPFRAVFGVTDVMGSVMEWTTLLAMLVYWLVAVGIVRLLLIGKSVSTPEAAQKLKEEERK